MSNGSIRNIAILGGGGVGGYLGARLAEAGLRVTLFDGWQENIDHVRRHGFALGEVGAAQADIVYADIRPMSDLAGRAPGDPFDLCLVAVKSYDTEGAVRAMLPHMAEDACFVSVQNGINETALADIVGDRRVLGCVCARISVELTGPGAIRRSTPRGAADLPAVFRIGKIDGAVTPRLEEIVALIAHADTAIATGNLIGERWSKLCVNAMRNPVSAVTGLGGNGMDKDPLARRVVIDLGAQAARIGLALGYELESIGGIPPQLLKRVAEGSAAARSEVDAILVNASAGEGRADTQRPSMSQDVRRRRKTEIDHINGLVVRKGNELGLPVDCHEAMVALVEEIERGEIAESVENLRRVPAIATSG